MKLRPLGGSPLRVSPLGLGLAALGRPGYINLGRDEDLGAERDVEQMRRQAHQVLEAAWRAGIRYFDVARSYGRAESFLAGWLRERAIGADQVTVGSKWGYTYTAGWRVEAETHEVKEHTASVLRRQWAESHEELGPHLHLYQIHSATRESGVLENPEVIAELVRLRSEHGVRIGLTLSGPAQGETLLRALEQEHGGSRVFDTVQATWNLLEPSAGPALRQAREAGLGVIVKEALANGRLTERNREPGFAQRRAELQRQAHRLGTTMDALALAAALAQPWADVVLSGAATPEQLHSNLRALDVPWDEEAGASLASTAEAPGPYWRTRGSLRWS